jgi:cytoskeletal protein RodZ
MSFGNTLRAARESLGITTSELAARTHMLVQIVEGLENEDFRRIPAPIYGRGFIKLYSEAVGLDPKPLQTEFMELFARAKEAPGKAFAIPEPPRRAVPSATDPEAAPEPEQAPAPEPMSAPEPAPAAKPNPSYGDLFTATESAASSAVVQPEPAAVAPVQQPKRSYSDLFGQTYANEAPAKPSAAERFRDTMSNVSSGVFSNVQKLPPNIGRIVTVSALAAVVLVLIGWGVAELYKATTPGKADGSSELAEIAMADGDSKAKDAKVGVKKEQSAKKPAPAKDAKDPSKSPPAVSPGKLKSTGPEIPALYID